MILHQYLPGSVRDIRARPTIDSAEISFNNLKKTVG